MDETTDLDRFRATLSRDPAVSIMFAVALLLIPLLLLAGATFVRSGHPQFLFAALLLTGAFAVAGMVLGLMRGLRRESTIRNRRA